MTFDINELRRLTQSALAGPDGTSLNWIKLLQDFQQKVSPAAVSELLDRLDVAESEALEEARLNGMGGEREAALMAKLEAAEKERDNVAQQLVQSEIGKRKISEERDAAELMSLALRAKIAEMERQEPIGEMLEVSPHNYELKWYRPVPFGAKLYLSQTREELSSVQQQKLEGT